MTVQFTIEDLECTTCSRQAMSFGGSNNWYEISSMSLTPNNTSNFEFTGRSLVAKKSGSFGLLEKNVNYMMYYLDNQQISNEGLKVIEKGQEIKFHTTYLYKGQAKGS